MQTAAQPTVESARAEFYRRMDRDNLTPLWEVLTKVTQRLIPGSSTVPFLIVGATDARFFRRKGVVAYGYGLMSERIPFGEFSKLFHGNNERVDQETLALMTPLWENTVKELLG